MAFQETKPEHEVAYQDLCTLVNKHADKISALELLAVAANMVGKLAAMQDQRMVSPAQAMDVIAKNLEKGNYQVIQNLANPAGHS